MKVAFLEARSDIEVKLPKSLIDKLPDKISLITTVQHIGQIEDIKNQLKTKKIYCEKGRRCQYQCQVLGCDVGAAEKVFDKVNAFLYIGSGLFHPKLLLIRLLELDSKIKVFQFNPFTRKYAELMKRDVEKLVKRKKGALLKFHSSKNIGILVSTKPGQYRLKDALNLKKELTDKDCYILISDTLDFNELENFPYIDCFVNTMCNRIGYDDSIRIRKPIINIDDI